MRNAIEALVVLLLTACGGSQAPAEAPSTEQPAPSSAEEPPKRAELTAQACEAGGGSVVGDIGDGAIHRADYRCPSGAEPSGTIKAAEGAPVAVEGSVCCPK